MKKILRKLLQKIGYDLIRIEYLNKMTYIKDIDYELDFYNKTYDSESIQEKKFYNIGGGSFFHPFWTNIDFDSKWYEWKQKGGFINHNLLDNKPFPIKDNHAEVFYTSHVIEHIMDDNALFLFNDVYRSLRGGGVFRIVCPDIELLYNAYKNKDFHFNKADINHYSSKENYEAIQLNKPLNNASLEQLFLYRFAGSVSTLHADGAKKRISDEEVREIFSSNTLVNALNKCKDLCDINVQKKYPGNHINWWSKEKVIDFLKTAGFENVYESGYLQSFCPILRNADLFDNTSVNDQLYIEAIK